jgi:hypothetical protein
MEIAPNFLNGEPPAHWIPVSVYAAGLGITYTQAAGMVRRGYIPYARHGRFYFVPPATIYPPPPILSVRGATRESIERIVRILDTLESRRAAGASEVSPYAMQLYCGLSKSELTRTMLSAENIGALLYQNPDTAAIGCLSIIRARTRCNQILSDMETAQKRAAQYANYMQANRTARKPNIDLESAA